METTLMPNIYETITKCVEAAPKNPVVEVRLNLATCNFEAFVETIHRIDNLSDSELLDLVGASYRIVFRTIIERKDSVLARFLFSSSRFLTSLLGVLSSERTIDFGIKSALNKIMYDYFQLGEPDKVVEQLLISISNVINKETVPALIVLGMTGTDASRLAICFHSAYDDTVVTVRRINYYLIHHFDQTTINEQKIADIYLAFFSRGFTNAFIGAMVDSYPKEAYEQLAEGEKEVYGMISNAVLGILDYMPTQSIINIITKYSRDFFGYYKQREPMLEPRVRIMSLSEDYRGINYALTFVNSYAIMVP